MWRAIFSTLLQQTLYFIFIFIKIIFLLFYLNLFFSLLISLFFFVSPPSSTKLQTQHPKPSNNHHSTKVQTANPTSKINYSKINQNQNQKSSKITKLKSKSANKPPRRRDRQTQARFQPSTTTPPR
jgi:hypothetical protein